MPLFPLLGNLKQVADMPDWWMSDPVAVPFLFGSSPPLFTMMLGNEKNLSASDVVAAVRGILGPRRSRSAGRVSARVPALSDVREARSGSRPVDYRTRTNLGAHPADRRFRQPTQRRRRARVRAGMLRLRLGRGTWSPIGFPRREYAHVSGRPRRWSLHRKGMNRNWLRCRFWSLI